MCNTHESKQQDSVDQKVETEIRFFWLKKLSAEEVKRLKSCLGGTQTRKKNTHIFPGLQESIF